MLARLTVPVPFLIVVPEGARFEVPTYEDRGMKVIPRPPVPSDAPAVADIPESIDFEGVTGYVANALQVDFQKESFDRRADRDLPDPDLDAMTNAVARISTRLRTVTRFAQIPLSTLPNASWRLQYLNDDGSELASDPHRFRSRVSLARNFAFVAVSQDVWQTMWSLPTDWSPPVWDDLLLDATAAWPKVGTSIVLAAAALEVFISETLDQLVSKSPVPPHCGRG